MIPPRRLVLLFSTGCEPEAEPATTVLPLHNRGSLSMRRVASHALRYDEVRLLTYRLPLLRQRLKLALVMRLFSRGRCIWEDETGQRQDVTMRLIASLAAQALRDAPRVPALLRQVRAEIEKLALGVVDRRRCLDLTARPVYLRTDLVYGLRAGGSVGHIAGVLNNLGQFAGPPLFLTTDRIPTVDAAIQAHTLTPERDFGDFQELPTLAFNTAAVEQGRGALAGERLAFIYQRYSLNNYTGARLAAHNGVPFVLEYNGSEAWMGRHWGKPLRYEALSLEIEMLNLRAADVVVVVSRPMKDELVARGIEAGKILVNPNGVDPERYSPAVDGAAVRAQYGLAGKTVAGFIGTYGRWHGAEVLAEAWGRLLGACPEYRNNARLLMIGDGLTMPEVRAALARHQAEDTVVLTGTVPQAEGPAHLAACDVLVSPHVPNADGTPFFGSPTKLFEYMAMGKGIVASNLDQIGEILSHDETAWLVKPGKVEALMDGLQVLLDDAPRRQRLGEAARREVVAKYTWRAHTRRIIEKLHERCGP